jgi:hypothetical protein
LPGIKGNRLPVRRSQLGDYLVMIGNQNGLTAAHEPQVFSELRIALFDADRLHSTKVATAGGYKGQT